MSEVIKVGDSEIGGIYRWTATGYDVASVIKQIYWTLKSGKKREEVKVALAIEHLNLNEGEDHQVGIEVEKERKRLSQIA